MKNLFSSLKSKLVFITVLAFVIYGSVSEYYSIRLCGKAMLKTIGTLSVSKIETVSKLLVDRTEDQFDSLNELAAALMEEELESEKTALLSSFISRNESCLFLTIVTNNDKIYRFDRGTRSLMQVVSVAENTVGKIDKNTLRGPFFDFSGREVLEFSVPVYDSENKLQFVLSSCIDAGALSFVIRDIKVGKTGYCYILDEDGTLIAHKDVSRLKTGFTNAQKDAARNPDFVSVAKTQKMIMESPVANYGLYTYNNSQMLVAGMKAVCGEKELFVFCAANLKEYYEDYSKIIKTIVISVAAATLFVSLFMWGLLSKIFNRLIIITNEMKEISEGSGDLKRRLPKKGNDEIGSLAVAYNQTVGKIHEVIISVKDSLSLVHENSSKLANEMVESSSALTQISGNVQETEKISNLQASSVSEMVSSTEEIIKTISNLDGLIEKQSDAIENSVARMEDMVNNVANITQAMDKASADIKGLSAHTEAGQMELNKCDHLAQDIAKKSEKLLEASAIISELSDQTKLLSINATIEAAHAGEYGKGFAVVADEIQKLSDKTAEQSNFINENLKQIADEMLELGAESKNALDKINTILELTSDIEKESEVQVEIIKKQSADNDNLLNEIKIIDNVTQEVMSGSGEMLIGGNNLMTEIKRIDEFTSVIKGSMTEMSAGVTQINNSILSTKDLSGENKNSVEKLMDIIGFFEV